VVCGHSYGGCVISSAAKVPSVVRLVYLCALMLDEGEEPLAMSDGYEVELTTALVVDEDAGTLSVDPARAGEVFYGDSPARVAAAATARLRPMPFPDDWSQPDEPAWASTPSTCVVCERDKAIPPAMQRQMSSHASEVLVQTTEGSRGRRSFCGLWDSDHSPFLTRPGDVAELVARDAV
jgi:pimeloyl-ACP methyl ester carboxylesterase